jgi:hypothetical protein
MSLASLSNRSEPRSSATTENLGTLEGIQEFFWATEPTKSRLALVIAEVVGPSTPDDWKNALGKVRQRYPILAASIAKTPGARPHFEPSLLESIPLRVTRYEDDLSIDQLMAEELAISFGRGEGALARVVLCHGPERSLIVFVGHHAACDGLTIVNMVQDLIAATVGESLGPVVPIRSTTGELLGLPGPPPYSSLLGRTPATECPALDFPFPTVSSQRVEADTVAKVVLRARQEKTTVHGALVAAFITAGQHSFIPWRTEPVVCLSPIDLRPLLKLEQAAGVLTTIHPTIAMPTDRPEFWDFARTVSTAMPGSRTIEAARGGTLAVREVVSHEPDPYDPATVDRRGFFNHHLMVSNYGAGEYRTDFGSLKLAALYPSHISGGTPDTQTISAITVAGALHVTHASRAPIPSFLKDSLTLLLASCD